MKKVLIILFIFFPSFIFAEDTYQIMIDGSDLSETLSVSVVNGSSKDNRRYIRPHETIVVNSVNSSSYILFETIDESCIFYVEIQEQKDTFILNDTIAISALSIKINEDNTTIKIRDKENNYAKCGGFHGQIRQTPFPFPLVCDDEINENEETTDIEEINCDNINIFHADYNENFYDLNGNIITNPIKGNIYIKNKRKIRY